MADGFLSPQQLNQMYLGPGLGAYLQGQAIAQDNEKATLANLLSRKQLEQKTFDLEEARSGADQKRRKTEAEIGQMTANTGVLNSQADERNQMLPGKLEQQKLATQKAAGAEVNDLFSKIASVTAQMPPEQVKASVGQLLQQTPALANSPYGQMLQKWSQEDPANFAQRVQGIVDQVNENTSSIYGKLNSARETADARRESAYASADARIRVALINGQYKLAALEMSEKLKMKLAQFKANNAVAKEDKLNIEQQYTSLQRQLHNPNTPKQEWPNILQRMHELENIMDLRAKNIPSVNEIGQGPDGKATIITRDQNRATINGGAAPPKVDPQSIQGQPGGTGIRVPAAVPRSNGGGAPAAAPLPAAAPTTSLKPQLNQNALNILKGLKK